jgi:hypothetical protein
VHVKKKKSVGGAATVIGASSAAAAAAACAAASAAAVVAAFAKDGPPVSGAAAASVASTSAAASVAAAAAAVAIAASVVTACAGTVGDGLAAVAADVAVEALSALSKAEKRAVKAAVFKVTHPVDSVIHSLTGASYGLHMVGKASAPKPFQLSDLAAGVLVLFKRPLPDSMQEWLPAVGNSGGRVALSSDDAKALVKNATIFSAAQTGMFRVTSFGQGSAQRRFNGFVQVC